MAGSSGSNVRRRRLGRELKRLREEAGHSVEAVAEALGLGKNTVYRYESGQHAVRMGYVRLLLDHYGTEPALREALLRIAKESRRKGWWTAYSNVMPEKFEMYVELEAEASSLHAYETSFVHGLLQTEDYARSLLRAMRVGDSHDYVDQLVALRMNRQEVFTRPDPLRLWLILDESALRRPVGGAAVMRAQLDRLVQACDRPNVTVQVLPYENGPHAGMNGAFAILEFPDTADPDVGYAESALGNAYVEEEDEVRRCSLIYKHLCASALPPDRSEAFISRAAKEFA